MNADPRINPADRSALLSIARAAVDAAARGLPARTVLLPPEAHSPALSDPAGSFVTLTKTGHLRGCIGSLFADKPLWESVRDAAWSSAHEDHRFPPVAEPELKEIEIEVSVLSPLTEIPSADQFIPGEHGIVIEKNGPDRRRGVFLPKVATEMRWGRDEMLSALCKKAGLPINAWMIPGMRFWIFTVEAFSENFSSNLSG